MVPTGMVGVWCWWLLLLGWLNRRCQEHQAETPHKTQPIPQTNTYY